MITLSTILYEKNFSNFFDHENWFWKFQNSLVTNKMIVINNLSSINDFIKISSEWKKNYDFKIFFVSDYENEAKKKFNLNLDKNNNGYVYTMPYYVMFINTKTEYILNVATDCMGDIVMENEFIVDSINELKNNIKCLVTTLPWVKNNVSQNGVTCGEHEMITYGLSMYETENFHPSYGFSDQVFLTSIKNMEESDFNCPDSGKYFGPIYCGGICFEKKMIDYFSFSNKFRFIYNKNNYYIHNQ